MMAAAANADSISTSATNGFARLLFTLDPVAHATTDVTGGVIIIHFDRKVALDANMLVHGLSAYVSESRGDADGQTFRLALTQSLKAHTSTSGNRIAIDLVPDSFSGTPPDLPAPASKTPPPVDVTKLPALPIRAGAYSDHTRLVFDWPQPTRYTVFPAAGHFTIKFAGLASPDYAALTRIAPPWVKAAGWRVDGSSTVLEFNTDSGSAIHASQFGGRIVVDVSAPKSDAAAAGAPVAAAKGISAAQTQAIAQSAAILNAPKDAAPAPAPVPVPAPQTAATQAPPPAQTASAQQPQELPAPTASKVASPGFAGAPKPIGSIVSTIAPPPPLKPADPKVVALRYADSLSFVFPHATAIAAFIRAGTAWIVVEGAPAIDADALKTQLGDFPSSFQSNTLDGTSTLQIGLKASEQISAYVKGADTQVTIAPRLSPAASPISLVRNDDGPHRAALGTMLPGANHVIGLTDPAVGDILKVIPARPGRAVADQHSYLEFTAIPTAAGLVIRPSADDLTVTVANGRVSITRPDGLALTPPVTIIPQSPAVLPAVVAGNTFVDFAHWGASPGTRLYDAQRRLLQNLARAPAGTVVAKRLALARFDLANGLAAEAFGLIQLMQRTDPGLESDPQLQVMRGAAEYAMGRYRDALTDLSSGSLEGNAHAAVWRGLAAAALEDWPTARHEFLVADPVLHFYPAEWQARAKIAEVAAMLETGSANGANRAMAKWPKDLPPELLLQSELVRAELMARTGNIDGADRLFDAVEDSGNEFLAVRAIYARTDAEYSAHRISAARAIGTLEHLRFRWRGDDLELKTLRKLGALYFAKKDWRRGLQTLRVAAANFPNSDIGRQAQDDMRAAFETLFLKGKADKLPPLESLALFYDFVDLTPIGPNGDDMIRRMADRLVAVDLLGPAATLLKYQIDNRLDGIARAQVATRLAMLDLLDHQPKDALAALRTTRIAGLPDDVNRQRLLLEARALAALKQYDQATDLIAADDAPETRALRADIYWESGQWAQAGQSSEALLPADADPANPAPLAAGDKQNLMRAAIAYSLANDQASLERLRVRFANRMTSGTDASAFVLITQKVDTQDAAFRDTAARIASIDTLETFMKDFQRNHPD